MVTSNAEQFVRQFALLQGRLVRNFLSRYRPKDREKFCDVPNGTLVEGGEPWTHHRHGAGVAFVNSKNIRVNAHVAMAEYPEGIDGGRLFEYLESLGVVSVFFNGHEYMVTKPEIDGLVDNMLHNGLLRPVVSSGYFSHRIFELTGESNLGV